MNKLLARVVRLNAGYAVKAAPFLKDRSRHGRTSFGFMRSGRKRLSIAAAFSVAFLTRIAYTKTDCEQVFLMLGENIRRQLTKCAGATRLCGLRN